MRLAPIRMPATAATAMVATSQGTATLAGLDALRSGGSAADAAVAAAAVLCVAEPMSTGIGGDAFALVWDGHSCRGLDAGGASPLNANPSPVQDRGGASVVVPGVVGAWAELLDQYGKLGLDTALRSAIDMASDGVAAGYHCSAVWQHSQYAPKALGLPPAPGQVFRLPELSTSLRAVAEGGPDGFYRGPIADAIVTVSWLELQDLARFAPSWVEPLSFTYHGVEVLELPAPTQGVAALEALGILATESEHGAVHQVHAAALALEDAARWVHDGADVGHLLNQDYLNRRAYQRAPLLREPGGGTVYVCAVDGDGMAVSLIQSLYAHFGSGVVAPSTGIVLNNRAACFAVGGAVEAGRRPYHTTIPGMLLQDGHLRGPFGVVGGFLQAQAHLQLVSALVDDGLDPQAALDRPRFRIDMGVVHVEEGPGETAGSLAAAGYLVQTSHENTDFGGGQFIDVSGGRIVGGSDARKDGFAAGF